MCRLGFPSGVIFLLREGLPSHVSSADNEFFHLLYGRKSHYFIFILKIFLLGESSRLTFFSIIKMLLHFLLACTVSDEKFVVILIFVSLYTIGFFLFAFKIFLFTTPFNQFNCDVPWCSFMFLGLRFVKILGSVRFIDFIKFENFSAIISLNIFFASTSSDSPITHILGYLKLSHNSQMLDTLLFLVLYFKSSVFQIVSLLCVFP